MVRMLKVAMQKTAGSAIGTWDRVLARVLAGYRRRPGTNGLSPFEMMYEVVPRFEEHRQQGPSMNRSQARFSEVATILAKRADPVATPRRVAGASFAVGDLVLLYNKNLLLGLKVPFGTARWTGPYIVYAADHPRYALRTSDGRRTCRGVHARRITAYYSREDDEEHHDERK